MENPPALPGWAVSAALGTTQTIGYGTLYYAFGVLAPGMAEETGLSLSAVFGTFSLAMIGGSLVAPRAGAVMDRRHPAKVMAAGSLVAAAVLTGWALIPGVPAFIGFLLASEVVSVLVLYEAAFVTVAHVSGPERARGVIAGITFVAGFASTVFWPLTQWLLTWMDWRGIYLAYAGLHLAVCVPVHVFLGRLAQAPDGAGAAAVPGRPAGAGEGLALSPVAARMLFLLMLAGFSMASFVISAVHLHLIPLLGGLGLGGAAALVGACIGPAQVGARLLEFATARRTPIHVPSVLSVAMLAVALAVLLAGAPDVTWGVAFALAFGIGQGLAFIVRGMLPLMAFGRGVYGTVTGRLNSVRLFVTALAPFVTALVLERAGPHAALGMLGGMALAGTGCMIAVVMLMRRRTSRQG